MSTVVGGGALALAAHRIVSSMSKPRTALKLSQLLTSSGRVERRAASQCAFAVEFDVRLIVSLTAGALVVCGTGRRWTLADAPREELETVWRAEKDAGRKHSKVLQLATNCATESNASSYKCGVRSTKSREYLMYERLPLKFGHGCEYEKMHRIGKGTSGEVFVGSHRGTGDKCAIKKLKAASTGRLEREVRILTDLRGGPNIIQLLDVAQDEDSGAPCLVFEHVDNTEHKKLYPTLDDEDVRYYMYELLKALDFCHSRGVMHRDVKPRNVVIDHSTRKLRLIDFGLAEIHQPGQEYSVKVSSLYYKPPELLLGLRRYDYSLDVWSLGCMFAGLVFRKEPFFRGQHDQDQVVKIVRVLGTDDLFRFLRKYRQELDVSYTSDLPEFGRLPKKPWLSFLTEENSHLVNLEAIDLIQRMLVYDPAARISVKEAMEHPYFAPVREREKAAFTTLSCQPGPLGVVTCPDGLVTRVDSGGQGERLGVKPGWRIDTIHGAKFSVQVLKNRIAGAQAYSITFRKDSGL